jgi:hypothetical protein
MFRARSYVLAMSTCCRLKLTSHPGSGGIKRHHQNASRTHGISGHNDENQIALRRTPGQPIYNRASLSTAILSLGLFPGFP